MKKIALVALVFLVGTLGVFAQNADNVAQWQFKFAKSSFEMGEEVELVFQVQLEKGWSLYSSDCKAKKGVEPTQFEFAENGSFAVTSTIVPVAALAQKNEVEGVETTYFTQKGEFRTKVRLDDPNYDISGTIKGMLYNERLGKSIPFQKTFHFLN